MTDDRNPDGEVFAAVIAVTQISHDPKQPDGVVVSLPQEWEWLFDGPYLSDNQVRKVPSEVGCYGVKVQIHYSLGYMDGYRAPGEDDWELEITEARRLGPPAP
ncbi:MAG TPA: hypothetical protein VMK12_07975, partial [Anaeromyxobacteraceae bacterium]|nr:hypothetical protein [Anaeromyxobacteraceae bacterium]